MDFDTQILCQMLNIRQDANEANILARKLEFVKSQTYAIQYPQLMARQIIPVASDVDPGAMSIVWESMDWVGEAKVITNHSDDVPYVDTFSEEVSKKVHKIGDAYRYSTDDLQRALMSGVQLEQRRANAARMAIELKIEKIAAIGESAYGLEGFYTTGSSIVGASAGAWSGLTAAQIIDEVNATVNACIVDTKGTMPPNTLVLGVNAYTAMATKRYGVDSNETALSYFLKTNPHVKTVQQWIYGDTAGATGNGRAAVFYKDPMAITLEIAQEFQAMPAQLHNFTYSVPCSAKLAGVAKRYPKSMRFIDGVSA